MPDKDSTFAVALAACDNYVEEPLRECAFRLLEAANLPIGSGMKILVKPNLLSAKSLACVNPVLVASVCQWLLEKNVKVKVADSPGFGKAAHVAAAIGLEPLLKPLGLKTEALDKPVKTILPLAGNKPGPKIMISRHAMECDLIISAPRIKAHSQMRITLAVKNCFGAITGLRKALVHAKYGENRDYFADCLAALWSVLPPVAAIADGIVAMHITGPSKGEPFPFGLLAASASAAALDKAILQTLKIKPEICPLAQAMMRRSAMGDGKAWPDIYFPLLKPEDFNANGFRLPQKLQSASFNPFRLLKSLAKRSWMSLRP